MDALAVLMQRQAAAGLHLDACRNAQWLLQARRRQGNAEGQAAVAAVRWRLEQQRERSRDMLARADKLAALGRMASGLVHDMSHPLGAIMLASGTVDAALAQGRTAHVAAAYAGIVQQAERLREQLQRLATFGRHRPLRIDEIDLRAVVDAGLRLCAARLETDAVDYRVDVPAITVRADPERLELAIANVLFNAVDAMEGCKDRCIELRADIAGPHAQLSIRDHGPGLSEEARCRLFEPFFTTKQRGRGVGLGLVVSAESMALMHGRIEGRNHCGGGAEFVFSLPLASTSQR